MINSTSLMRRLERYVRAHPGPGRQSGATRVVLAATGDATVLARLRKGSEVSQSVLSRLDEHLKGLGY